MNDRPQPRPKLSEESQRRHDYIEEEIRRLLVHVHDEDGCHEREEAEECFRQGVGWMWQLFLKKDARR
jgi:hypothetical protein